MKDAILEYKATENDEGKTVERIWRRKFEMSSALLKDLKLSGKLRLNGKACRSVDIIANGDVLTANVTENEPSDKIIPIKTEFKTVYEDEFIHVVDKPRNMSVHPSVGNFDNTLANGIIYYWQNNGEMHKFHAVNRIDKDTSGICVIAKNRFAHGVLSAQMKDKRFKRKYLAVVHGVLTPQKGVIDIPIKRAADSIIKRITAEDGKKAVTHYEVIKECGKYALIDIFLETGRTHQIRVHFSEMGHPLVGDWLYGNGDNERNIAKGHLLHAYYAEFYHPFTRELMRFELPIAEDMKLL